MLNILTSKINSIIVYRLNALIFFFQTIHFFNNYTKIYEKNLIWSASCILSNHFVSFLCASNLLHPHLCGKLYIVKWYYCYWNIMLVWQFWVSSSNEKHTLSTYILRFLFFFQPSLLWKFSKYKLKFPKEINWKWINEIFFTSIFFLLFTSFQNFSKQNSFSFLSHIFYQEFCFSFFHEKEYCGRYSSVGLKWNILRITSIVCKICNFQTSTISSSQVTGTLLFYTVRIGNHYPQNECVEGDGKFLLHMEGLKEWGGCFWYGTFEKIQVIFMVWLVYTLFFI